MYNTLVKSQLEDIENSKFFVKDKKYYRPSVGVSFYNLVNLDSSETGYYLGLREHENSDSYDYIWCYEKANADDNFTLKFEDLLDNLDDDIKTELLFHLDIFV